MRFLFEASSQHRQCPVGETGSGRSSKQTEQMVQDHDDLAGNFFGEPELSVAAAQ